MNTYGLILLLLIKHLDRNLLKKTAINSVLRNLYTKRRIQRFQCLGSIKLINFIYYYFQNQYTSRMLH